MNKSNNLIASFSRIALVLLVLQSAGDLLVAGGVRARSRVTRGCRGRLTGDRLVASTASRANFSIELLLKLKRKSIVRVARPRWRSRCGLSDGNLR